KGSPTVIFTPAGDRYVVPRGTAALGTGGSGDLLDGIAGTMLAQTQDATVAACCAAWVHGRAAEFCEYVRGTTLDDVLYSFPRDWLSSFEIGYRATAASLSDLAAMGARPLGILIALTLPKGDVDEAREFATGIREGASAVMCPIVGGDLSSGRDLSLTITALGSSA